MRKVFRVIIIIGFIFLALPEKALADGIIVPEPPICDPEPCLPPPIPIAHLEIRYHKVSVTINEQVAITHVDQVFFNPNSWQVEGTYIFPIPEGAVISSFSLWIDGEPIKGDILDAEQARHRYEEIVRSLQDPALLEYTGSGLWQAKIFPIPPGEERRVELEYAQTLTADSGLVKYVYPLGTEKFSVQRLETVSINVTVHSQSPIRAVYSPTHAVEILQDGKYSASIGYEENDVLPDRDFGLFYSIGDDEAFHLLTYRNPEDLSDRDGFFMALMAPRPEAVGEILPKDVILVLDRSGSMEGEKFQQAQDALVYILRNLKEYDRFNIVTFSTAPESFAPNLKLTSATRDAEAWVKRLSARGNTDINRALLEAISFVEKERPTYLIFLTDGLPTEGVVESQDILLNFENSAPANLRLFAFGVGYDVDTYLLDTLSGDHHGTSTYVLPGERLDETLSSFYEKISTPVLTDLTLNFGDITVYDLYPDPLPDLYLGSQILVLGRYSKYGDTDITLTGMVNGEKNTFRFTNQRFDSITTIESPIISTLPRLWATRKVGYLLKLIRLSGPDQEIIQQIVQLSIRYGIVTPYTSYLVTEETPLGEGAQNRIADEQFSELQALPAAPVSGRDAVRKSSDQSALTNSQNFQEPVAESADLVRMIGSRTFVFNKGIWIDTAFDPEKMETIKVVFLSDNYFDLVASYPELGPAFALGQRVIAFSGGSVYEVVPLVDQSELKSIIPVPTKIPVNEDQYQDQRIDPTVTKPFGLEPEPSKQVASVSSENKPSPIGGCINGLLPLSISLVGILVFYSTKSFLNKCDR